MSILLCGVGPVYGRVQSAGKFHKSQLDNGNQRSCDHGRCSPVAALCMGPGSGVKQRMTPW
jgi:hypothetical protein